MYNTKRDIEPVRVLFLCVVLLSRGFCSFFYLPKKMEILIELIDHTRFLVLFFLTGWLVSDDSKEFHKCYFFATSLLLIIELAILGTITLFNQ